MEYSIRPACPGDLDGVVYVENSCFPSTEAATEASLKERLAAFRNSFLVAESQGKIVGLIDGCVTKQGQLTDDLYESTALHDDSAPCQMVFGLAVHPDVQHQGIAAKLMKAYIAVARKRGKACITLTCKKHMIAFYEQFGYTCGGLSVSTHGGVPWYDMTLSLENT